MASKTAGRSVHPGTGEPVSRGLDGYVQHRRRRGTSLHHAVMTMEAAQRCRAGSERTMALSVHDFAAVLESYRDSHFRSFITRL
jgi:hypothetical protein